MFVKEAWAHTNFVLPIDFFNASSFRNWLRAILYACNSRKAALCILFFLLGAFGVIEMIEFLE